MRKNWIQMRPVNEQFRKPMFGHFMAMILLFWIRIQGKQSKHLKVHTEHTQGPFSVKNKKAPYPQFCGRGQCRASKGCSPPRDGKGSGALPSHLRCRLVGGELSIPGLGFGECRWLLSLLLSLLWISLLLSFLWSLLWLSSLLPLSWLLLLSNYPYYYDYYYHYHH